MIIKKKNDGVYVKYDISENHLSFKDGELEFDLEKEQCGYDVRLVVSEDESGKLTLGSSRRYIAEIDIPKRQSRISRTDFVDQAGIDELIRVVDPFDIEKVTLTLWAIEE